MIACGGGLATARDTFALLRQSALTVWLRAQPEDHWNRVVQQGDRRPMADHPQAMGELRRLLKAREPLYAEAEHMVDTSQADPRGRAPGGGVAGRGRRLRALTVARLYSARSRSRRPRRPDPREER